MVSLASRLMARLGGAAPQESDFVAAVPEGSRIYAIGDIHGRVDLLESVHRLILSDAGQGAPKRRVVVYVGDYVDRGEDFPAVLDLLLERPLPEFQAVPLMGNHERSLLEFLRDPSIGPQWVQFGGDATLFSYGVRPPQMTAPMADFERARQQFARNFPPRHRRFLETLACTHVEGDYFFTHAGVRPGVPLAQQDPEDLLWIRDVFLRSGAFHGKVVVHGHSISQEPAVHPNRIGIDTGAFASGRLTCLVLEGRGHRFLQT